MLFQAPNTTARRDLVDRAAELRAAMERVRDARPETLGEVSGRWQAAQRAVGPAAEAYWQAWRALPYRDRLARRLGREWPRAAEMLLFYGRLGFQTAEDVALD